MSKAPDSTGWWLWYDHGDTDDTPERLFVVGDAERCEVADDGTLCEILGIDYDSIDDSAFSFNYWESTDCEEMGGEWVKDANQAAPLIEWARKQPWYSEVQP